IHVTDLAEGHVAAVTYLKDHRGTEIFNIGTGTPYSVLEMIRAYSEASGVDVPYEIGGRRAGDLQDVWSDATKAKELLGWEAKLGLAEMCRDSWNWQSHNPRGYEG
ncbi:MAG: GDP-mannose 4,6-dehydratase, partial [Lachnospiraceae bacterium]|nr:GDP-mannose 4,6-dehydratase [Lachnospiraceae bacterium]